MNSDSDIETIAAANMATTSMDYFIHQLRPEPYRKGENVELFITECEKFFAFSKTPVAQRTMIVICLLERNLIEAYESVDKKITDYKERLRNAFGVKTSLMQNIKAIFSYKMTNEKPEKYFEEIHKLVEKFFDEKLTKENLEEQLLIECYKEKDLKRDLYMNDIKGVDNIKARIKKLHEAESVWEDVTVIERHQPRQEVKRSYRDVARHAHDKQETYRPAGQYHEKAHKRRSKERQPIKRNIECWSCHKEGHISRQCPKKTIKCFACGEQGHIRRQCPRVRCTRCNKCGHHENECYTNLNRLRGRLNEGRYRRDWQFQGRIQGQRPIRSHDRRVNNVEESLYEESIASSKEYPNAKAPTEVEIVGAIHQTM